LFNSNNVAAHRDSSGSLHSSAALLNASAIIPRLICITTASMDHQIAAATRPMPDGCVRGGDLRFRPSLRIAALGFAIMLPAIKLTVEPVIAEQISLIAILLCICGENGMVGVGAKSVLSASALSQLPLSALYVAGILS